MGSESKKNSVPEIAKKVVRNLKEIVNGTEQEIYAVLKECDMDPNRAVERLLAQDTFHEVRSKRERRKEIKEALDSRTRSNNVGLSCGRKIDDVNDRNVVQSGLAHVTYNELGKAAAKGDVGSVFPSVTSYTTDVLGKITRSDSFCADNGRRSLRTGDSLSASTQVCPRLQPSLLGVRNGHLSMADIVRMGRASEDVVSHNNASAVSASGNSESSLSLQCQNNSEQQVFHEEWPLSEQPITNNLQELNLSSSSNVNGSSEHPSWHDNAVSLHRNCELDATQQIISEKIESRSISSKDTSMSSNAGLGSLSNSNIKNTQSSDFYNSHKHHEDVSSATSDIQQLSIKETKQQVSSPEDNPIMVLPNHLQVLAAECSHLSFGTYNGGCSSTSTILASNTSRSGVEEKSAAASVSSAHSVCHGDKQLGFDQTHRGTTDGINQDFLSSPHQELVKNIVPVETFGYECNKMASVLDRSLQKSHWVTPSLPLKQPAFQWENYSIFPREMHADSDSISSDVLAFLISQSQPARFSNAVSSISNPATTLSEVMDPGTCALPNRFACLQDIPLQSSIQFQQLLDRKGYRSLPQNQSYMATINSQQAFSGSTAYSQSHADMKYNLPQNRNEILMNRLPVATARDAFGHGNRGSSFCSSESFPSNSSLGYSVASSNFNDTLPPQYSGGHNLSSTQQKGYFSQWDYGAESRPSSLLPRTQYDFLGKSSAALSQYVNPEYSDHYHSQAPVVDEVQRPDGFRDLASKQLHQFWHQSH
ncbi:putative GBF-interacting protein [Lupinus albus]|uniref:Putative GBF-interacting protein n=1 Tax=Lupinus albus TaxID=3870 RepID=A0A6A4P9J2_LUPAL|nr:putative GBF-interacting protein [Lupinus albus]